VTVGNVPIVVPLGKAVGGTTILNSATCFRTPPALLDEWGLWSAAELDPYFRRVERIYGVGRLAREHAGRNAHVMERGAARLGWRGEYLHRAARGCNGSGVCAFGCPTGGKQHTGNTYVPLAWDAGAITVTGAKATRVLTEDGAARGVEARTPHGPPADRRRPRGRRLRTVGTPMLLQRSGVRHPQLGRNLSLHPATGVWAEMDEQVDMHDGVPQAYGVDEFAHEGLMLEGWAGPPDMLALSVPARGDELRRVLLDYRRIAQAGVMIKDTARGRVRRAGRRALLRYDVNVQDAALLTKGIARAAELQLAAGARAVHVPIANQGPVRTAGEARALRAARPGQLGLTAFHPLGTAAAGRVVDTDLHVRGMRNLLVADGSVVPSALGVNPQLTIMALATRAAYRALAVAPPTDEPAPATVGRAPALAR
jgi:choline dehydrogenase-like flavoprotein